MRSGEILKSLRKCLPSLAEAKFQIAAIAAFGVGYLGSYSAAVINPWLLAQTPLDEAAVGALGSIELLLLAFFSLVLAPFAPRFSYRGLALAGCAAAAFGYMLSSQTVAFGPMAAARVIMGIGAGIAIVAVNAAVASSDDPDRRFAMIYTVGGIVAAAYVVGLPLGLARWGYQGGFAICALMCLMALPFVAWLPHHTEGIPQTTTRPPQPPASEAPPSALAVILVLGSIGIYSIGEQALWAFAGEIGVRNVGIPKESVGRILAGMTLAGTLGGFLAWKLGARFGRALPVLVGGVASAVGRGAFMMTNDYTLMIAWAVLWGFSFYFISPYQMGVAAAMDRTGRVAVAAGAMFNFGYAFGPGIGGAVIGYLGQQALLPVVVGCMVISLLMLLPVAIAQDRVARGLRLETALAANAQTTGEQLDEVASGD
jgi:predicted MFS family arabinose efflux permease